MLYTFQHDLLLAARLCGGMIRYIRYEISYTLCRNFATSLIYSMWKTGDGSEIYFLP